jgi:hypothetical protein
MRKTVASVKETGALATNTLASITATVVGFPPPSQKLRHRHLISRDRGLGLGSGRWDFRDGRFGSRHRRLGFRHQRLNFRHRHV